MQYRLSEDTARYDSCASETPKAAVPSFPSHCFVLLLRHSFIFYFYKLHMPILLLALVFNGASYFAHRSVKLLHPFFFSCFFSFLLPRASRSWTQTRGQDFEGESHETTHITGGENGRRREEKKNKIWLSFHKPGGGAEPLELSYALGKRSPLVEALVHETRTTVLILYTQYHQR